MRLRLSITAATLAFLTCGGASPARSDVGPQPPPPAGPGTVSAPAPPAIAPAPAAPAWIAEETLVKIKLLQSLKSNHERSGDRVHFETTDDLLAPDRSVLVPKGTPVIGTVTRASRRGMLGKPGRLEFSIDFIQVGDQVRVPLRGSLNSLHGRDNSGGSISAALLLLGPAWLLIHGREVTVPAGKEFTVFVDQKTQLPAPPPSASLAANLPAAPAPVAAPTAIPSTVAGVAAAAVKPDLAHLSEIHLKNGDTITGSITTQKDGAYFIITELGQLSINSDMIAFIATKKS